MLESNTQWYEDNGLIERNAEIVSRRSFAAVKSDGLILSNVSACRAVEAMPGTLVHTRASARFFEESASIIASEKCAIFHPETAANAQIPITTIAVQKRVIATNPSSAVYRDGSSANSRHVPFWYLSIERFLRKAIWVSATWPPVPQNGFS
jgi:hypothetical protein